MAAPRIIRYESAAALRDAAQPWDDLWQRSRQVLPCGRAELISSWVEQLSPHAPFMALAVEADGQLVAALPLVQRRVATLVSVGALPQNYWSWAGDLLLDFSADVPKALAALISEIRRLRWPLLWFEAVPLQSPRWQSMLHALSENGLRYEQRERFRIGTVQIADQLARDWNTYEAAWSGNHRRHMRKALRKADEAGGVHLEIRRPQLPQEVELLLREGFEVEHRSWKGEGGSSVVASPEKWNFFLQEAQQLARLGHLELAFLRHQGQAIAFEYGWWSHGVYYTPKVGYDSQFAHLSPGQLLRFLLLKQAFARKDCTAIDFLGPLAEATAKWTTHTYPISKLVVETGNLRGASLLSLYRRAARLKHALRKPAADADPLKIVELDPQPAAGLPPTLVQA